MVAPTPHRRAVVPRDVAIRTTGLKCRVANTAALVVHVPTPGGYAVPPMVGEEEEGRGEEVSKGGMNRRGHTHTLPPGTNSPAVPINLLPLRLHKHHAMRAPTTRTF